MDIIRIDDPDDPRIAAYRDIRERDLVGREGCFVAEGKVVLNVLLSAQRFEPQSVLVLENRLAGLADTLSAAPAGLPIYSAGRAVMDAVAGFPIHRGVLAIGRRRVSGPPGDLLAALPRRALVVVLVGLANHDNVGAIFRNAAALGADAVLLDKACCDPLYRKAIRVSVGAVLMLPFAIAADAATLSRTLADHGFAQIALSPAGRTDIRAVARGDRMALFLGTEGDGLPADLLAALQTVRIAQAPGLDSLNVASASAIALHRLSEIA